MEIKRALIESGNQPEPIEAGEPVSNNPENMAEDEPKIRIIKPMLEVSDDEEQDVYHLGCASDKDRIVAYPPADSTINDRDCEIYWQFRSPYAVN